MPIISQRVSTPTGDFEVRRQGEPDDPLVIALHGFPDTASPFDALGADLVASGFQVAAPMMRGYAPSTRDVPETRTLFDVLARDAIGIADALAPGRPFSVVGHDNGAFATYSILRMVGPRVAAAVTLTAAHPAAVFANSGRMPRQMWRSRYAMFFQIPGLSEWRASRRDFAYLERLWRRWAAPGWELPRARLDEVKRVMRESWPAPLRHYRAMPFEGDPTPLTPPTLYLIGDRDGCVLPEAGAGQERFFGGEFVSEIVPGAGHFLHLEQPHVVNGKIVEWLSRYKGISKTNL